MLTPTDVATALPAHLKTAATQELADKLNTISKDSEAAEYIRNNFLSFSTVLRNTRYGVDAYVSAVSYVSYKIMGCTNQEAWKMTFPKKYQALVAAGRSTKEISAYVAGYNKGKLVNEILEQTLVPAWVLNQDVFQKAINTQAEIMLDEENSAKVRSDAADSLMNHLKRPETKQVDLNIDVTENSGVQELKDTLSALAQRSQELIGQGVTTNSIAQQQLGKSLDPDAKMIDVTPVTTSNDSKS